MKFTPMLRSSPKTTFAIFGFLKRFWYVIVLILIVAPSIISSIRTAVETENPTYPFFDLATRLLTADDVLKTDMVGFQENRALVLGMEEPEVGLWQKTKYGWKMFWFWWRIIGNVWLIFFPLWAIFHIVHFMGDRSMVAKNWWTATKIFFIYLFITHTVIFVHGLIKGNAFIEIPGGLDTFKEYFFLFLQILPFHGLWELMSYFGRLIGGVA